MFKSDLEEKSISPFLSIIGLLLAVAGGITFHLALAESGVVGYLSFGEALTGIITQYAGLALLIIPMVLIGSLFTTKRNITTTAIVLLVLFIGGDLAIGFYPSIIMLGDGWGGMAILVVLGIIRGVAFMNVNRGLGIPARGYRNGLINLYGWSFLVTFLLYFILSLIALSAFLPMLFMIAIYILIAQYYIDAICLVIIGIKFMIDARSKPTITKKIRTPAPLVPGGAGETPYQPAKPMQAEESVVKYCTYCGAQNFEGGNFCENCGKEIS